MPLDITPYVVPAETAVLVSECQEAVLGEGSALAGLAANARERDLVEHVAALLAGARAVNVRVFHCLLERRTDGIGDTPDTPLTAMMARRYGAGSGMAAGTDGARPVPGLVPQAGDVVVSRAQGITAFHETGLDGFLRSAGVRNVIFTGVSLNLAVFGGTIEAVNRGYRVVIPRDCVVGDPTAYAADLLDYSLRSMAWLSDSTAILDAWQEPQQPDSNRE